MPTKKKFNDFTPGDFLGDTHDTPPVGGVLALIQNRIEEPVEFQDIVAIDGDHYTWMDAIVCETLGEDTKFPRHRYQNKMVMVLQPLKHQDGWLVGWSYDGTYTKLANLMRTRRDRF